MREWPMRSVRRAVAWASLAGCLLFSAGMPARSAMQGSASQPLDLSAPAPADLVVVHQILDRWQALAEQVVGPDASWRDIFLTQLMLMTPANLAQIDAVKINATDSAAENYARLSQAMRDTTMQAYMLAKGGKSQLKLASTVIDQIFIPMTPCRIVDTRNVGGPIAASTQRAFNWVRGVNTFSWSEQGGAPGSGATACPYTVFAYAGGQLPGSILDQRGYPSAAMATVTVVNPTAAGNLVIWGGQGTFPQSSALNFAAGQTLANTTVIPWGQRTGTGVQDFTVRYNGPSGQADVVVDLVGFFVQNSATPLDCVTLTSTFGCTSASCINFTQGCPSGYTQTATYCEGQPGLTLEVVGEGYCEFSKAVAQQINYNVKTRCCRVPGQ
jgi:hypothetical protein